jgi:hypothetical protein
LNLRRLGILIVSILTSLVLLIWVFNLTLAQPSTEWSETYGGMDYDFGYSVVQTTDGGYAIAGETYSYGAGGTDVYLVKTYANGTAQWTQTYGGTSHEIAFSVVQTTDGGYAIAGYTESYGAGNSDMYLVKTDAYGIAQWNQTYGGPDYDYGRSVVQTTDGGYAIAGYTESYGAGNDDFWLVKTDAYGIAQWNQTYGGTTTDMAHSLVQTTDGGYAIAGYIAANDVQLVKTDETGSEQWRRQYGGGDIDGCNSVVQTTL